MSARALTLTVLLALSSVTQVKGQERITFQTAGLTNLVQVPGTLIMVGEKDGQVHVLRPMQQDDGIDLQDKDVILAVDGKPVTHAIAFVEALEKTSVGTSLALRVRRGGTEKMVTVTRPNPASQGAGIRMTTMPAASDHAARSGAQEMPKVTNVARPADDVFTLADGIDVATLSGYSWKDVAVDDAGDSRSPDLPDGRALAYYFDAGSGMLWFKVSLYALPAPNAFGVGLYLDTDADQSTGVRRDDSQPFTYDRTIIARVTKRGEVYGGTVGIGEARQTDTGWHDVLRKGHVALGVDEDGGAIIVGVMRSDLAAGDTFHLVAAVGSNLSWNDEVVDHGYATIAF